MPRKGVHKRIPCIFNGANSLAIDSWGDLLLTTEISEENNFTSFRINHSGGGSISEELQVIFHHAASSNKQFPVPKITQPPSLDECVLHLILKSDEAIAGDTHDNFLLLAIPKDPEANIIGIATHYEHQSDKIESYDGPLVWAGAEQFTMNEYEDRFNFEKAIAEIKHIWSEYIETDSLRAKEIAHAAIGAAQPC